ncbi:hypothetical protein V6R21_26895 [Limibacter armeniacum]|uniref:hypothetical protein n=1 Tax=Limibacter armeniacum TaxID=466084 RepID=UPI002FE6703D
MQKVTPGQILTLLLYVTMMSGIILTMSPGELKLTDEIALRVPTFKDVLPRQLLERNKERDTEVAYQEIDDTQDEVEPADSLWTEKGKGGNSKKKNTTNKKVQVSTKPGDIAIEYAKEDRKALDAFFAGLEAVVNEGEMIRVLHFGDSQLEGDRMTERLRRNMQNQFGGCGIGMVPITEIKNIRSTLTQDASSNWETYAVYGNEGKTPMHGDFGVFGKYFSFQKDSTQAMTEAFLEFGRTSYTRRQERRFEKMRLFFRNPDSTLKIHYKMNGIKSDTVDVAPEFGPQSLSLPISGELGEVELSFRTSGNPEFYGVSFDCNSGVSVDNIPFRGSSGTEFTKMHRNHLKEIVQNLNVRLLILQFGVNVVPQIRESYSFYERVFYRQLKYLQGLYPNASILVVGVSDMAHKDGTEMRSYTNIKEISAAQRKAAAKAGVAFWDLYKAMGGENSIIKWVDREPAWANKDYTHFTRRGANHVGDMLYNELMREYAKYKKRKNS